jgi:L-amino acid N-acyltransferase YncA
MLRHWAGRTLYMDESHVWYTLALSPDKEPTALPEGTELVSIGKDQVDLLLDVPFATAAAAAELIDGNTVRAWALRDGELTVFSCWTFSGRVPAVQAPGGWLELPPAVHFLEDSVAAPNQRGRGLAGATWGAAFDRLRAEGTSAVMTKVEVGNAPARKAVERFGFRGIATTRLRRIAGFKHVNVDVQEPASAWLKTALE